MRTGQPFNQARRSDPLQEDASWRRRLQLAAGVTLVTALCVAAILLVGSRLQEVSRGSASGEAAQSTAPERATAEDRSYAKAFDVSLEEAIRRLEMQDDTLPSDLERELMRNEQDTFAGLWLRHKPDYGITVATAGDPEAMMEKVEPYVEGTQWEGTVRIKRVEATLVELNAARAEAERMLDRLGIQYISGDNLQKNRMEIYVKNMAQVQRKLRASGLELPEHVVVMEGNWGPT
jgi:hypothetical protein